MILILAQKSKNNLYYIKNNTFNTKNTASKIITKTYKTI